MNNKVNTNARVNDLGTSLLVLLIGSPLLTFMLFVVTSALQHIMFF